MNMTKRLLVLLFLELASDGRGCCQDTLGRGPGPLDAGIHVGLIVIAKEDEVVSSFAGTGEGLETDITRSPIAGPGRNSGLFFPLGPESCTDTGRCRPC